MDASVARPPKHRLYSPNQILTAYLCCACAGAAVLMALNYRRQGLRPVALSTLGLAIGAIGCDLVLALSVHAMPIFYWVIALGGVRRVMRDASLFDAHVEAGGAKASSWGVAAAIVGALLVFVLTATLAVLE